ncbi:MAG: flagellin [Myxococcota bacterium]
MLQQAGISVLAQANVSTQSAPAAAVVVNEWPGAPTRSSGRPQSIGDPVAGRTRQPDRPTPEQSGRVFPERPAKDSVGPEPQDRSRRDFESIRTSHPSTRSGTSSARRATFSAPFTLGSSGLRITRAADGSRARDLGGFRADIRSIAQAQRNANDGISFLQIGEGALNEVSGILIRQRELAIQAANGTLGQTERDTINNEFQDLTAEINRIASVAPSTGRTSCSAAVPRRSESAQTTSNDRVSIAAVDARASSIGLGSGSGVATVSTVSNARSALASLDSAISQVASLRATFGTVQNRLKSAIRSLAVAQENTSAAESPDPRRRLRERDGGSDPEPGPSAGGHLGARPGNDVGTGALSLLGLAGHASRSDRERSVRGSGAELDPRTDRIRSRAVGGSAGRLARSAETPNRFGRRIGRTISGDGAGRRHPRW